jgi:hypothetical protein
MNLLKATDHIKPQQFNNLNAAINFAQSTLNRPFNVAFTIHWACAGGPGNGNARDRISYFQQLLRKWFQRHGHELTAYRVFEAGRLGKDIHTHGALHLPDDIEMADLEAYMRQILKADEDRVLNLTPITNGNWWRNYCCKDVPDDFARRGLRLPKSVRDKADRGLVTGKRVAFTQNIGPTARRRFFQQPKT